MPETTSAYDERRGTWVGAPVGIDVDRSIELKKERLMTQRVADSGLEAVNIELLANYGVWGSWMKCERDWIGVVEKVVVLK